MVSIAVVIFVFLFIAVRRIGSVRLQIWQVMLFGGIGVLAAGQISPARALKAVNPDVMLFLFGMFIIGQGLHESGYLTHLTSKIFRLARSLDGLVLAILFFMGGLSALLMNDTIAIIGTPVVLFLARRTGVPAKVLLLTLAFAVTIGSVLSPIGNPQNLLIAVNGGIANPFVTFVRFLLVPTLINVGLAYGALRLFYWKSFGIRAVDLPQETVADPGLARLSKISLGLLMALILVKISTVFLGLGFDLRLSYIALAGALPITIFSRKRVSIIRRIDWHTLVFFAAMFVLMESVWHSGVFQILIEKPGVPVTSTGSILTVSVLLSQVISNVPLVALYLPVLAQSGATVQSMMALAAGSTIAGNLSVLGAASNVIIIQGAEKLAGETLTFWEFVRVGVPVTAINVLVYWLYFGLVF